VDNDEDDPSNFIPGDIFSWKLREVLEKLRSASAIISLVIRDELAGSKDPGDLKGLYAAKGGVTCAIEDAESKLRGDDG
jgi:hypothetical protein